MKRLAWLGAAACLAGGLAGDPAAAATGAPAGSRSVTVVAFAVPASAGTPEGVARRALEGVARTRTAGTWTTFDRTDLTAVERTAAGIGGVAVVETHVRAHVPGDAALPDDGPAPTGFSIGERLSGDGRVQVHAVVKSGSRAAASDAWVPVEEGRVAVVPTPLRGADGEGYVVLVSSAPL